MGTVSLRLVLERLQTGVPFFRLSNICSANICFSFPVQNIGISYKVKKYFDESMSIRTRKTSGNIDTSKRKFNDEMLPLVRNLQRNNEKRQKMLLDANIIVDKFNIILDEKIKAAKKKYKSKFDIEKFYLSTTDLEPLHLLINISFNIEQDTNQPLETLTIKEDPVVGTYTLEQYRDLLQHLFNEIKDIIQNFQK